MHFFINYSTPYNTIFSLVIKNDFLLIINLRKRLGAKKCYKEELHHMVVLVFCFQIVLTFHEKKLRNSMLKAEHLQFFLRLQEQ